MANLQELSEFIRYTSYKIDWSNTRIVKAAANTINFLTLTDDDKVKCYDDIIINAFFNNNNLIIIIINCTDIT